MLVLSRKLNEEIVIPDLNITLRIVGMKTGRVQVGIDAPRDIRVTRPEISRGFLPSAAEGSSDCGGGLQ